ncbi:unnamed protein product [Paramecium pentaurelia]|uniref:RING-type domain-containing protein n=1 Tax=Paramecium pentaurelia TaxID=43138 RepID=A0A8S1WU90_9CILI|nr:unnamed protein product [Paramecium pentaurelia]
MMKILIIADQNPVQQFDINPNQKIYNYMNNLFDKPQKQMIIKLSPTGQQIDYEDEFSKYMSFNTSAIVFYVFDINGNSIQYTNSQLKKSISIPQEYGYCNQEIDEISLSRNQILNSTKSFNEEKLEMINSLSTSFQNIDINQDSMTLIQNQKCQFCTEILDETVIQTPCQHIFHTKCFSIIVESQLLQKASTLKCLCKKQLNFRILFFLDNKYDAEIFRYRYLLNQLQELEKNLQVMYKNEFRKCKNIRSCNFFYLHQPIIQNKHSYCPYCLQIDV